MPYSDMMRKLEQQHESILHAPAVRDVSHTFRGMCCCSPGAVGSTRCMLLADSCIANLSDLSEICGSCCCIII